MNIFLVFFCFLGVAAGTIDFNKALSEVEEGIGIRVAIHACDLSFMVNILRPFFRIDKNGPHFSVAQDLEALRLAMANQTIQVCVERGLRECTIV